MKSFEIFGDSLDIDYYIDKGKFQTYSRSVLVDYLNRNIDFSSINSILEIGSGTGELSNLIYSKNNKLKIDAFDISKKMYEFSRKTNNNINWALKEIDWFCKYEEVKRYDFIFSNLTLHWIDGYVLGLKKFLKNSKRVIFTVPLSDSFDSIEVLKKNNDLILKIYSKSELESILLKNFSNINFQYFSIQETYSNLLAFLKHLKKIGCSQKNKLERFDLSIFREKKVIDINYQFVLVDIKN